MVTILPAAAVPLNVGVVSSVCACSSREPSLSRLRVPPLSTGASSAGADGAPGAMLSTLIDSGEDAGPRLPMLSTTLAVMEWSPWPRTELVMVHVPLEFVVVLPIWVVPSNSLTVLPAAAVPVNVGVVSLVRLSVFDDPVSDADERSGAEGVDIEPLLTLIARADEATLVLPAASVAVAVMLCMP